jgi:hypothetical protein
LQLQRRSVHDERGPHNAPVALGSMIGDAFSLNYRLNIGWSRQRHRYGLGTRE